MDSICPNARAAFSHGRIPNSLISAPRLFVGNDQMGIGIYRFNPLIFRNSPGDTCSGSTSKAAYRRFAPRNSATAA
jgi:hypothetical protein